MWFFFSLSVTLFIAFTKCIQEVVLFFKMKCLPHGSLLTVLCLVTVLYGSHLSLSHNFTRHTLSVFQSCVSHAEEYVCSVIEQFLLAFFFNYQTHGTASEQFVVQNHPGWKQVRVVNFSGFEERETSVSLILSVEFIKNCFYSFHSFWNSEGFM